MMFHRRLSAAIVLGALGLGGPVPAWATDRTTQAPDFPMRLEAETGERAGGCVVLPSAATAPTSSAVSGKTGIAPSGDSPIETDLRLRTGFSGTGYVTRFRTDEDRLIFRTPDGIRAGLYDIRIGYSSPSGLKGTGVTVNGLRHDCLLPQTGDSFAGFAAGKVELSAGVNTIAIEKGWGYFLIDYIELSPAAALVVPVLSRVTPADPQATPEARALLDRLASTYGRLTLSGVYSREDAALVKRLTDRTPAILGGDLMDYSPSRLERGADPARTTEDLITAARDDGYILTISWHWNAPKDLIDREITGPDGKPIDALWYKGFNSNATTFDVERALADESSEEYKLLLRDIDAIAGQLKKLADAGVPVLWRPLHEAEGKWFWWGARGPKPFVKLWRLMFDRLTKHHGLHNLLWVYTGGPGRDWYPGDAYVDVVGIDAYPTDPRDPLSWIWEEMLDQYANRKLIALTEIGGVPDVERMRRHGANWAYWTSWTGNQGPAKLAPEELKRIYTSPTVLNRAP